MSQRSFCWWYEKVIRIDQEKLLCPEDPNPHFPDSAWFDSDIYPPSHKNYYQDPRASRSLQSLPHHDRGATPTHRRIPRNTTLVTAEQIRQRRNAITIIWTGLTVLAISALMIFADLPEPASAHPPGGDRYWDPCSVENPQTGECTGAYVHPPHPTIPTTRPPPPTQPTWASTTATTTLRCSGGQHVDGTGRGCHSNHVRPSCHCTLTRYYNRHVGGRHVRTEVPPCNAACPIQPPNEPPGLPNSPTKPTRIRWRTRALSVPAANATTTTSAVRITRQHPAMHEDTTTSPPEEETVTSHLRKRLLYALGPSMWTGHR